MNNLEKMARRERRAMRRPPRVRPRAPSKGAKAHARRILPRVERLRSGWAGLQFEAWQRLADIEAFVGELVASQTPGRWARVLEARDVARRRYEDISSAVREADVLYARRRHNARRA